MTETTQIITQLSTLSYAGIFGLSLLANIVIPVPEEAVLLGLGYAGRATNANFFMLVVLIISGLLISDLILYGLSRRGNRYVHMFYNKFFSKRLEDKREWLESNIENVIFFSRFMLQLRFLGPFLAGQCRITLRKFLTYELAALIVYVPLVVWTGWYFHRRINDILHGIGIVKNIMLIAIACIVLVALYRQLSRRSVSKQATATKCKM